MGGSTVQKEKQTAKSSISRTLTSTALIASGVIATSFTLALYNSVRYQDNADKFVQTVKILKRTDPVSGTPNAMRMKSEIRNAKKEENKETHLSQEWNRVGEVSAEGSPVVLLIGMLAMIARSDKDKDPAKY